MKTWRITISLTTDTQRTTTDKIEISRGVFQGSSLNALWFCICMNSLSNALNETTFGFNVKRNKVTNYEINVYFMCIYTATRSLRSHRRTLNENDKNNRNDLQ